MYFSFACKMFNKIYLANHHVQLKYLTQNAFRTLYIMSFSYYLYLQRKPTGYSCWFSVDTFYNKNNSCCIFPTI